MPAANPQLAALNAILDRVLKRTPSGDGPFVEHFRSLVSPLGEVVDAGNALFKLNLARDPSTTPEKHFKTVASTAAKFKRQIDLADSATKLASNNARAYVQNVISTKLNLKPDAYGSEVRAVFRQLSVRDRTTLLSELLADPMRGPELAALLRAPLSVSGLTAEMRDNYFDAFRSTHAAEELAQEELIEETAESAAVALATAQELAAAHTDEKKLADIVKREQEATAAAFEALAKVHA